MFMFMSPETSSAQHQTAPYFKKIATSSVTVSGMCWKLFQEASLNVIHGLSLTVKKVWLFITHTIISQGLLFLSFEMKNQRQVFKQVI